MMAKLKTASGVNVWVNPAFVVSLWPTFEDEETRIVMHDGTQTEVKGSPNMTAHRLATA